MLKHTFIDAGLEKRLRLTVVSGTRLTVSLTLDDADDLAGFVAAEANHCADSKIKKLLDGVYDRLAHLEIQYTDQPSEQKVAPTLPRLPNFTGRQGQYLAFIYYYTKIHKTAPAEADMSRYFRVSAPAVHQMIVTLTERGLITRNPGEARSIRLAVSRAELPDLE